MRGVEHLSRWPRRRRNRQGGLRNRRPAASSACAVAASARRVWSTQASAHAAVRAQHVQCARFLCSRSARAQPCRRRAARRRARCAFTTALTCGLVQSFAASVVASYATARASSSAHTSPAATRTVLYVASTRVDLRVAAVATAWRRRRSASRPSCSGWKTRTSCAHSPTTRRVLQVRRTAASLQTQGTVVSTSRPLSLARERGTRPCSARRVREGEHARLFSVLFAHVWRCLRAFILVQFGSS